MRKYKNNRLLPTDNLLRSDRYPNPRKSRKKVNNAPDVDKEQLGKYAGKYLSLVKQFEPDKRNWKRKAVVEHARNYLGWNRYNGVEAFVV